MTLLFGSFKKELGLGNRGPQFFTEGFKKHKINAIYNSFVIDDLDEALKAAKIFKYSGLGIASPFKSQVARCAGRVFRIVDKDPIVEQTTICNTIIINNELNKASLYNTDYIAVATLLKDIKNPVILGYGGLAKTIVSFLKSVNQVDYKVIDKSNWSEIHNIDPERPVINCTTIELKNHHFKNLIDPNVRSEFGKAFYSIQAREQFKLYTGLNYD